MRFSMCRARSMRVIVVGWLTLLSLLAMVFVRSRWTPARSDYVIRTISNQEMFSASNNSDQAGAGSSRKVECVQPTMDLKDPVMMKFYKKINPVNCLAQKQDLIAVNNGTLKFQSPLPAGAHCDMYPLIRGPGDYKISYGPPVKEVKDATPLVSEFFKINCTNMNKTLIYENIHLGVHFNSTLKNRAQASKLPANGLQLSVVMLGFDSMSRVSWLRRLPKTRDYFVNDLGAIELEGYGIMGDGTPAALLPMLTGKHEQELPEARRSKKGAKTVDQFPWIWKDFQKNGYITSWADAEKDIAPFNYRLLGFQNAPTDFFMRPFYLAAAPAYKKYKTGCHGSLRKHQVWFNYAKDIMTMYKDDPKFMFHFYASLSHGDNNPISMADDDLRNLLQSLEHDGHLDNTLFILFADHGCRFSSVRATYSGKMEERTPYFALRFPKWFHTKHPDLIRNLKTNVHRLTTPMDIHETLMDVLRFDGSGTGSLAHRGISLFKEIPKERTCEHADIAPHWCACLSWKKLPNDDSSVREATQAAVDFINGLTKDYRDDCAALSIASISNAYKSQVSDSVLRFKETKGDRGLEPVMAAKATTKAEKYLYQLTFVTSPGNGEFEVTLRHEVRTKEFFLSPKSISRINKYGNAPHCVLNKNREIRQYCYCKVQLT